MITKFLRHCPDNVFSFVTASYYKIGTTLTRGARQFHTLPQSIQYKNMKVKILPALKDNYMYLLIDEKTKQAAAVDPVEPSKILSAAEQEGVSLTTILTTHHHWDHAGGNADMLKAKPNLEVVGGDERIHGLTKMVHHNDELKVGDLSVKCLSTPCHTSGSICYFIEPRNSPPVVFTGDTLFTAGCGRFFEGTAQQMYRNLIQVLGALPDDTQVFSGHEYAVNNLNFAETVEPKNADIKKRLEWALSLREEKQPTVPSTIGEEKKTNPFMRVCEEEMQKLWQDSDPISVMRSLRERKDSFKG